MENTPLTPQICHSVRKKINTKNSGLPKLLRWSNALRLDQNDYLLRKLDNLENSYKALKVNYEKSVADCD